MDRSIDKLMKAVLDVVDEGEYFTLLETVTEDGDGKLVLNFRQNVPFHFDQDGKVSIKPIDSFSSELDRLNAINNHRELLIDLMENQCGVYQIMVDILNLYDRLIGQNSFEEIKPTSIKLH